MKVFIIVFNRLTPLINMTEFLDQIEDIEPVVVNMNSTYPPLLEWLSKCPYEVMESKNIGPHQMVSNLQKTLSEGHFAVTDPDLDLFKCPLDLFDVLRSGIDKYPQFIKVGLSLEINDIPDDFAYKNQVLRQEGQFWKNKIDKQFYIADVATTMAVYRSEDKAGGSIGPALRTERPYTAKHIDWYSNKLSDEEIYYIETLRTGVTHWSEKKVLRKTIPFL